ncbi:hypothetical protein AKJ16_DCAP26422 [Drosera capensis]
MTHPTLSAQSVPLLQ